MAALGKHTLHLFKMLVLGKTFTTDVRQNSLRHNEFAMSHDFAEALAITHNEEIQSKHFGGSVTVSIEGYTCHYRASDTDPTMKFDFHSFLSDDTTQMANTVYCHMKKLCHYLKDKLKILSSGGRLMTMTDGCAKQYKCSTSIFFMSLLATSFDIVVDRAVACPGHGKSLCDALNGVDKNTILRRSNRKVQSPEQAMNSKSTSLQVQSFNNTIGGKQYSAAEDCKRVLELEGGEGVKSVVKRQKRELNRGVDNRYWHVRPVTETLEPMKCCTIQIPNPNLSFKDMYHYYTCKAMGVGVAALRQIPCSCTACDEKIRLPWVDGMDASKQPRFGNVTDCYLNSILEDSNGWYIVDLVMKNPEDGDEEDIDEAHQEVLYHVTTAVAQTVVVGEIGAVATDDEEAADGYYLVQFTGLPYTDQAPGGSLKCEAKWLNPVPGARKWFTKSVEDTAVNLVNVVSTGVVMLPISQSTMPPSRVRKEAEKRNALKISEESHNFILDEITRRERLEYDPSRVFVDGDRVFVDGDEEEYDSESDSEN